MQIKALQRTNGIIFEWALHHNSTHTSFLFRHAVYSLIRTTHSSEHPPSHFSSFGSKMVHTYASPTVQLLLKLQHKCTQHTHLHAANVHTFTPHPLPPLFTKFNVHTYFIPLTFLPLNALRERTHTYIN